MNEQLKERFKSMTDALKAMPAKRKLVWGISIAVILIAALVLTTEHGASLYKLVCSRSR